MPLAQNAPASPQLSVRCTFSFRHIVGYRSTGIYSAFSPCGVSKRTSQLGQQRTSATRFVMSVWPPKANVPLHNPHRKNGDLLICAIKVLNRVLIRPANDRFDHLLRRAIRKFFQIGRCASWAANGKPGGERRKVTAQRLARQEFFL